MKYRAAALLFIMAGILAHAVWIEGAPLALLAVLPALACRLSRRELVAAWWAGYYFVGLFPLAGATSDYFGGQAALGIAAWAGVSLVHCATWTIGWAPPSASALRRVAGMLFALLATLAPPLGALGFLHPLLATGSLLPGSGFYGLALLTLAWCLLAAMPRRVAGSFRAPGGLLALGLAACVAVGLGRLLPGNDPGPDSATAARALSTRIQPATTFEGLVERVADMAARARFEARAHPSMLVFPETAVSEWRPATEQLVRSLLLPLSYQQPILFGTILNRDQPERSNAVAILERGEIAFFHQRQPVPLGMWAPWSDDHFRANWMLAGVTSVGHRSVVIHVCAEEFPLALSLLDFALAKPNLIVVLSNHWWSQDPIHDRIQERHTEAVAQLFGVPYLRAVNRGPARP